MSEFTLKSGRVLRANRGIFGLTASLELTEGYDGGFWFEEEEVDPQYRPLTSEERAEIADMMIDRWQRWKSGT